MPERVKLQEPGSELVMTVSKVTPEVIDKNDYFLFANGSKEVLVPQSSTKGRFETLGITDVQQMVGKSVRFARSMKMSRANKPYWDIDWASGAEAPSQNSNSVPNGAAGGRETGSVSGVPAESPAPPPEKVKLTQLYLDATDFVLGKIVPKFEEKEIGLSDTTAQSRNTRPDLLASSTIELAT